MKEALLFRRRIKIVYCILKWLLDLLPFRRDLPLIANRAFGGVFHRFDLLVCWFSTRIGCFWIVHKFTPTLIDNPQNSISFQIAEAL